MAAYAAVVSLKRTIHGLLNSSPISLSPFTRDNLNSAYDETTSLQNFLKGFNCSRRDRLDGLEGRIRDFANKLEDVLELHEFNHLNLLLLLRPNDTYLVTILGRQSSCGRWGLAKTIFEDVRNGRCQQTFDCWAWVRVVAGYEPKLVLISIIAQASNLSEAECYRLLIPVDDEILRICLSCILNDRRYMIVLDDVDDVELVNYLNREISFPEQSNGSVVFINTNSAEVDRVGTIHFDEQDEEVLLREITSFGETVKKMKKDCNEELSIDVEEDGDDEVTFWSNNDFGVEMVGHSRLFETTRKDLLKPVRPDDMVSVSLLGGKGSGGTMTAHTIIEDVSNGRWPQTFDCWAWVTVGSGNDLKQVLIKIIYELRDIAEEVWNNEIMTEAPFEVRCDEDFLNVLDVRLLCMLLCYTLNQRSYMIVLDAVDDVELVNYLCKFFPDQSKGSVILITTSTQELASAATFQLDEMLMPTRIFNDHMGGLLYREFLDNRPHYQSELELKIAIKKIIDNCQRSYISAAKTILFLSKSEKTVELWSKIAMDKENPIFMISDEISEMGNIKMDLQHYNGKFGNEIKMFLNFRIRVDSVKDGLYPKRFFSRMQIKSFFGMAGIGKSALARKLFEDESICSRFDHRVWVTLGPKYQTREILIDILGQVYPGTDKLLMKGDEELVRELCVQLSCKRCLIVFDDLHSKDPLLHLKDLFPDIKGIALVTTRLSNVAKFERDDTDFEMKLLDKEESWRLLHQKVFNGGLAPLKFEKAGRKIAESCDGLPLMILTVADELLKAEISQVYWEDVASDKEKSVFENAHHRISQALLPSYQSIPQYLKPFFHYIGVFSERYEISATNLTNLLIAEGFLEPNPSQMEEEFVAECLKELVDRSLVMVQRKVSDSQIKTCRLSSVFWHLSKDQVMKNKLFHAMNISSDCSIESNESPRRFCIRNSILLGMKEVQNSMTSVTSSVHSLLCVSPLQKYPVPLYFDMRLLRVMNAITIHLYEFPIEVVRLLHLKYLGITCRGKIPGSISNLWKLQYLIVKQSLNIRSSEDSSLLPLEIWDMKELRHLQIMGGCLPDHKCGTAGLVKLSTLLDVSAESCREEVLKWMPNLKRLGIRIELEPDDDGKSFSYLNNIHHLNRLESLKCVVVNPEITPENFSPPAPVSMFPRTLKKLSLSGLGYSWKHMSIIGNLENLEVLKLKCYAFQGPQWEMEYKTQFQKLKFLLIEDSDVVQWRPHFLNNYQMHEYAVSFKLQHLCMKHCYELQELPAASIVYFLDNIEIVDCNPLTLTEAWTEQIRNILHMCEVNVHRSWAANTLQE